MQDYLKLRVLYSEGTTHTEWIATVSGHDTVDGTSECSSIAAAMLPNYSLAEGI
jgi:hypothetical protein